MYFQFLLQFAITTSILRNKEAKSITITIYKFLSLKKLNQYIYTIMQFVKMPCQKLNV